jgi:arginine/ornithine transport system permease protein
VWLFTYVIRGTPMLVQLFLLYYGLAQFEAVRNSPAWPWLSSAWFCAIAAFAINTCAYTTEMHGAIKALPAGEIEAAKAMGMSLGHLPAHRHSLGLAAVARRTATRWC